MKGTHGKNPLTQTTKAKEFHLNALLCFLVKDMDLKNIIKSQKNGECHF